MSGVDSSVGIATPGGLSPTPPSRPKKAGVASSTGNAEGASTKGATSMSSETTVPASANQTTASSSARASDQNVLRPTSTPLTSSRSASSSSMPTLSAAPALGMGSSRGASLAVPSNTARSGGSDGGGVSGGASTGAAAAAADAAAPPSTPKASKGVGLFSRLFGSKRSVPLVTSDADQAGQGADGGAPGGGKNPMLFKYSHHTHSVLSTTPLPGARWLQVTVKDVRGALALFDAAQTPTSSRSPSPSASGGSLGSAYFAGGGSKRIRARALTFTPTFGSGHHELVLQGLVGPVLAYKTAASGHDAAAAKDALIQHAGGLSGTTAETLADAMRQIIQDLPLNPGASNAATTERPHWRQVSEKLCDLVLHPPPSSAGEDFKPPEAGALKDVPLGPKDVVLLSFWTTNTAALSSTGGGGGSSLFASTPSVTVVHSIVLGDFFQATSIRHPPKLAKGSKAATPEVVEKGPPLLTFPMWYLQTAASVPGAPARASIFAPSPAASEASSSSAVSATSATPTVASTASTRGGFFGSFSSKKNVMAVLAPKPNEILYNSVLLEMSLSDKPLHPTATEERRLELGTAQEATGVGTATKPLVGPPLTERPKSARPILAAEEEEKEEEKKVEVHRTSKPAPIMAEVEAEAEVVETPPAVVEAQAEVVPSPPQPAQDVAAPAAADKVDVTPPPPEAPLPPFVPFQNASIVPMHHHHTAFCASVKKQGTACYYEGEFREGARVLMAAPSVGIAAEGSSLPSGSVVVWYRSVSGVDDEEEEEVGVVGVDEDEESGPSMFRSPTRQQQQQSQQQVSRYRPVRNRGTHIYNSSCEAQLFHGASPFQWQQAVGYLGMLPVSSYLAQANMPNAPLWTTPMRPGAGEGSASSNSSSGGGFSPLHPSSALSPVNSRAALLRPEFRTTSIDLGTGEAAANLASPSLTASTVATARSLNAFSPLTQQQLLPLVGGGATDLEAPLFITRTGRDGRRRRFERMARPHLSAEDVISHLSSAGESRSMLHTTTGLSSSAIIASRALFGSVAAYSSASSPTVATSTAAAPSASERLFPYPPLPSRLAGSVMSLPLDYNPARVISALAMGSTSLLAADISAESFGSGPGPSSSTLHVTNSTPQILNGNESLFVSTIASTRFFRCESQLAHVDPQQYKLTMPDTGKYLLAIVIQKRNPGIGGPSPTGGGRQRSPSSFGTAAAATSAPQTPLQWPYSILAESAIVGPITAAPPQVRSIFIFGDATVGAALAAQVTYLGGEPAPCEFIWTRISPNGTRTDESKGFALPYSSTAAAAPSSSSPFESPNPEDPRQWVLTERDVGCEFRVSCIPVRKDGAVGTIATSRLTAVVTKQMTMRGFDDSAKVVEFFAKGESLFKP